MHAASKTRLEIKQLVILSLFYLIILNGTLTLFGDLLTYFINAGSEYFSQFLRFSLFLTGPLFIHWPSNDDSNFLKDSVPWTLETQDYLSFRQVPNKDSATWLKDTYSITFWVPLRGSSYIDFLHGACSGWLIFQFFLIAFLCPKDAFFVVPSNRRLCWLLGQFSFTFTSP